MHHQLASLALRLQLQLTNTKTSALVRRFVSNRTLYCTPRLPVPFALYLLPVQLQTYRIYNISRKLSAIILTYRLGAGRGLLVGVGDARRIRSANQSRRRVNCQWRGLEQRGAEPRVSGVVRTPRSTPKCIFSVKAHTYRAFSARFSFCHSLRLCLAFIAGCRFYFIKYYFFPHASACTLIVCALAHLCAFLLQILYYFFLYFFSPNFFCDFSQLFCFYLHNTLMLKYYPARRKRATSIFYRNILLACNLHCRCTKTTTTSAQNQRVYVWMFATKELDYHFDYMYLQDSTATLNYCHVPLHIFRL